MNPVFFAGASFLLTHHSVNPSPLLTSRHHLSNVILDHQSTTSNLGKILIPIALTSFCARQSLHSSYLPPAVRTTVHTPVTHTWIPAPRSLSWPLRKNRSSDTHPRMPKLNNRLVWLLGALSSILYRRAKRRACRRVRRCLNCAQMPCECGNACYVGAHPHSYVNIPRMKSV